MTELTRMTVTGPNGEALEVEVDPKLVFTTAGGGEPIPLVIDGEVFYAVSAVPAMDYGALAALFASLPKNREGDTPAADDTERTLAVIGEVIETLLLEESSARLAARLRSRERPVGLPQVIGAVTRLMERYGEDAKAPNPTQPQPPGA